MRLKYIPLLLAFSAQLCPAQQEWRNPLDFPLLLAGNCGELRPNHFHGGIDTQEILPFGNRESVENAVRHTIDVMNVNGGYIFAAAHNIQEDVPPQNLVYMFDAARNYDK